MSNNRTPFKKRENPLNRGISNSAIAGDRDKYTATMDKDLRKRVKIASATKGIQLSTFIEEACYEKLEREGF